MAMKQWIADKKNMPIIIAVVALVLIGAGALVAFETGLIGGGGGAAPDQSVAITPLSTSPVVSPSLPPSPGPSSPAAPASPQAARQIAAAPGAAPGARQRAAAHALAAQHAAGIASIPVAAGALQAAGAKNGSFQMPTAASINTADISPAQKAALLKKFQSVVTPKEAAAFATDTPQQKTALEQKVFAAITSTQLGGSSSAAISRNPFAPTFNAKKLTQAAVPPPVAEYVPFTPIAVLPNLRPNGGNPVQVNGPVPVTAPLGRVVGIINSNGIRAIYEIDGQDTIVTPGTLLPEDGGRVQSIQADSITVRLTDSRQTVQVPLSAGTSGGGAGNEGQQGAPPSPDGSGNGDNNGNAAAVDTGAD